MNCKSLGHFHVDASQPVIEITINIIVMKCIAISMFYMDFQMDPLPPWIHFVLLKEINKPGSNYYFSL